MNDAFKLRITKSRLYTGLLAIPREHATQLFPADAVVIRVLLGSDTAPSVHQFVPAVSTAKEARVYGMKDWFVRERLVDGDTLQMVLVNRDERLYRLSRVARADGAAPLASAPDEEFSEGRELLRLHRRKERNRKAVLRKKSMVLASQGKLVCEVCDFDFFQAYGDLGEGFAECHHRVPLAELTENHRTRFHHLAIVCANCHRMLHRRPIHRMEELRRIVQTLRVPSRVAEQGNAPAAASGLCEMDRSSARPR